MSKYKHRVSDSGRTVHLVSDYTDYAACGFLPRPANGTEERWFVPDLSEAQRPLCQGCCKSEDVGVESFT